MIETANLALNFLTFEEYLAYDNGTDICYAKEILRFNTLATSGSAQSLSNLSGIAVSGNYCTNEVNKPCSCLGGIRMDDRDTAGGDDRGEAGLGDRRAIAALRISSIE